MTPDELVAKYRPLLLGFFADCFGARKLGPADVGMELDRQFRNASQLLREIHRDAQPAPVTRPEPARPAATNGTPANGHANGAAKPAVAGRINGAGR